MSNRVSDYITFEDAAQQLDVSAVALRKAVREGRLASYEVLGKTVLLRSDVARYPVVRRAEKGRAGRRARSAPLVAAL